MPRRSFFVLTMLAFGFAFLYVPILSMVVFSFNSSKLVTVWAGIAISYRSDWPLGFFVGVIGAGFFLAGRAYAALGPVTRSAPRSGNTVRPATR